MNDAETLSLKEYLASAFNQRFGKEPDWPKIELETCTIISQLTEHQDTFEKDITTLYQLKQSMMEIGIGEEGLEFIDEEIDLLNHTKTLAESNISPEKVSDEDVIKYLRLLGKKDSIVSLHKPYNYEQTKDLIKKVYKKTGNLRFFITPEKRYPGRIISEVYQHPKKVPLITLMADIEKDNYEESTHLVFFGEKPINSKYKRISDLEAGLRFYNFITNDGHEFMLLSTEELIPGDFIITGMTLDLDDFKALTDSFKLRTKLPFMFIHKAENRVLKYDSVEEVISKVNSLKLNKEDLLDYPFIVYQRRRDKNLRLVHPEWFKRMVWAWILHCPQGLQNTYPLHMLIIAKPSTGKSLLIEGMNSRCMEARGIFSGSSSTLKSVVPSFKYNPAKLGYLAECNRFAFLDEFLRCISATRGGSDMGTKDESLAMMNDLLEHQKREAGSGVSSVKVNMSARALAVSNPVRETGSMQGLLSKFDHSFLSRWLVYFQTEDHISMIQNCNDDSLGNYDVSFDVHDFISVVDFCHEVESDFDLTRVLKIFEAPKSILSGDCLDYYTARCKHHIKCLMDGLVKFRCLDEGCEDWTATEEDYSVLDEVWGKVVGSWLSLDEVMKVPLAHRIHYLPEACSYVFQKLCELGGSCSIAELRLSTKEEMDMVKWQDVMAQLVRSGMVTEERGRLKAHFVGGDKK